MSAWRWRREASLAIISSAFALVAAEVAIRFALPAAYRVDPSAIIRARMHRPDSQIGWVLASDSIRIPHRLVDKQGTVQYDVVYSVSGGQRRTSKHEVRGPALLAAGCSFTFGHGLNDQDTWPWLLQEHLPEVHVMNVGCMGYGTDQALLAAERQVLQSKGHINAVVLGFADFQIERNRSPQGWMSIVYPFSKPLFRVSPDGVEYVRQVRFLSAGSWSDHSELLGHILNTLGNRIYGIPSHNEARQLTTALITTFAKRFGSQGVRFAVVMLPYADDRSPQSQVDQNFVVNRLRAAGIPVLVPDFPRLSDDRFETARFTVSHIDRHPNREYNLALTNQIVRFLKATWG
jgi:hypothetical protein